MTAITEDSGACRISVIVPFYNEARLIERCIGALKDQEYPADRFEIVMVDNNSTDGSPEVVAASPRVRLVHEPLQGRFAARNRGLRESTGEVLAFTDADTAPTPTWLKGIDDAMRDERVQVVVGRNRYGTGSSPLLRMMEDYEDQKMHRVLGADVKEHYIAYGCNMALRRSAVTRVGDFVVVPRGSDVVMVRKILEAYGPESVVYRPDVEVVRMEIDSVGIYYQKAYRYGADYRTYGALAELSPLGLSERLEIARDTARSNGYSAVEKSVFWALLGVGAAVYEAARRWGR